ncbi:aminotransferase class I/II-fold pyridoxal phosphate-dependent enzyme [Thermus tengchongensis]|uniref:aminotransferase class I/II-fold pyridoxal phosphate-dependent enzyme n=1 Tax=Thermus tengchongensis TaxID=1214928 RepID=UPI000A51DF9C|nr:aminotransferase class I/II-fold pyridoxal phosphate-dependent enzyme [Thermus tengchongensis]
MALQYGPTEGYGPLRAWVAEWLGVKPEEVLITTGSQQALDLLGKVFLDEGSPVLLEAPSYMGAIQAFRAYGPRFLTVPAGRRGRTSRPWKQPSSGSAPLPLPHPLLPKPLGRPHAPKARKRLLEMVMAQGLVVVEDDAYRELYFGESRLPSLFELAREAGYPGVIYLSSFSKILSPGLRVAFAVATPRPSPSSPRPSRGWTCTPPSSTRCWCTPWCRKASRTP